MDICPITTPFTTVEVTEILDIPEDDVIESISVLGNDELARVQTGLGRTLFYPNLVFIIRLALIFGSKRLGYSPLQGALLADATIDNLLTSAEQTGESDEKIIHLIALGVNAAELTLPFQGHERLRECDLNMLSDTLEATFKKIWNLRV